MKSVAFSELPSVVSHIFGEVSRAVAMDTVDPVPTSITQSEPRLLSVRISWSDIL